MSKSMRVALRCIGGCIGVLAAHTAAQAQDQTAQLERVEEVIVTGSRSPKAVDKIPGAINIVSEEDVSRSLSLTQDATAVLARTVPGYSESSQAVNSLGETLRGRVPLRLFDGIPQSTPLRDGSRNSVFTDMDVVGRIEVINGPSAAEGIGAAGGIINYISKEATEPGLNFNVFTNLSSQFETDSDSWKAGGTLTYKSDAYDMVLNGSLGDRGITYDANGRRIGLSASSSAADSETENLFLKAGMNFGADDNQRLQFSASHFKLKSKGGYHWVEGSRALRIPDTSERGPPLGTGGIPLVGTEFNEFEQYVVTYKHFDLFGGSFTADAYTADQAMRFPADNGTDRQDPLIAPLGTLVDQSEVASEKKGARTSWTRGDLFTTGLELHVGLDVVEDETEQSLALTNRVWVPPMNYKSIAPYLQLSYDIGPVTVSGGMRREDGELQVDDYTTTFFRNRAFVEGGTLDYQEDLFNAGAIWRITGDWSVFASYSEGFTLPNIGIPLRNINQPGQSVEGILDLEAIIFDSKEVGFNWRGTAREPVGLVLRVQLRSRRLAQRRSGHAGLRAEPRAGGHRRLRVHGRLSLQSRLEGHGAVLAYARQDYDCRPAERSAERRDGCGQHQPRQAQRLGRVELPGSRRARPRRDHAARARHQRGQEHGRAHARLHAVRPDGELRHGALRRGDARRREPDRQVLLPVVLADRLLPQLLCRPRPHGVADLSHRLLGRR